MPTKIDYLSTYLRDHRAGAEAGSDLAARLRDENVDTPYEDFLTLLAQQIEQDVATLESIMERFDVDRLDADELAALVERAEIQLAGLREHHAMASVEAFGG